MLSRFLQKFYKTSHVIAKRFIDIVDCVGLIICGFGEACFRFDDSTRWWASDFSQTRIGKNGRHFTINLDLCAVNAEQRKQNFGANTMQGACLGRY